jgi:hypothetical protein
VRGARRTLLVNPAGCSPAEDLAAAATERFAEHPDAAIITSMPGLADLTGARVLAEIGDDRNRFADARGLKAYAGSAPVTRASGKSTAVLHRRVKNQRLASVGYVWAFAALTASPGARAHYDRRKAAGDRHVAAQRNLFNRLLGCLHHCLHHRPDLRRSHRVPHNLINIRCARRLTRSQRGMSSSHQNPEPTTVVNTPHPATSSRRTTTHTAPRSRAAFDHAAEQLNGRSDETSSAATPTSTSRSQDMTGFSAPTACGTRGRANTTHVAEWTPVEPGHDRPAAA